VQIQLLAGGELSVVGTPVQAVENVHALVVHVQQLHGDGVKRQRQQFVQLFRHSPGPVAGVNAANELINLGGGLGVRFAALLAPVALVSAISSTSTFFVFAFGILITLLFPKLGREDLSSANLVRKGLGAILIALGVFLIERK